MMRKGGDMKRVILVLVLFLICCTTSTSRDGIRGIVTAPDGTPLPGVTVTLHSPRGDIVQTTDIDGRYEFRGLLPSVYRIEAQLSGFSTVRVSVNMAKNRGRSVPLTLRVASVA